MPALARFGPRRGILVAALTGLLLLALTLLIPGSARAGVSLVPVNGAVTYADAQTFTVTGGVGFNVLPPNPITPGYTVSAAVAATAFNAATGQRCYVADAHTATLSRDAAGVIQVPVQVYAYRTFAPGDPCRQLVGVPIAFTLTVTPNGTIQSATAAVQTTINGDTPPPTP